MSIDPTQVPANTQVSTTIGNQLSSRHDQQSHMLEQIMGGVQMGALHNFPGDQRAQWRMVAKAEGGQMVDRDEFGNGEFPMTYFYAHKVEVVDAKTGEISVVTRVVIMDANGNGVKFVSGGIAKALYKIIQVFGFGPWTEPIMVKVETIKTRSGFKTYTLVPAE